jgi:hypothetical protein
MSLLADFTVNPRLLEWVLGSTFSVQKYFTLCHMGWSALWFLLTVFFFTRPITLVSAKLLAFIYIKTVDIARFVIRDRVMKNKWVKLRKNI